MLRMTAEEKKVLGLEILSYLLKNPDAGDTLEGIARFWTSPQRVDLRLDDVQDVLGSLVAEGILTEQHLRGADGSNSQRFYRLNPARRQDSPTYASKRKPGASK